MLRLALKTPLLPGFEEFTERPRWNIAPSQNVPVVRAGRDSGGDLAGGEVGRSEVGRSELAVMQWGFVPGWSRELPKVRPINARAETLATSGMFRTALAKRRCLVPADGFYEWRKEQGDRKQPMFIHRRDDGPFCFAGIWDRWKGADGEGSNGKSVETMAIITTSPNTLMKTIHNRMPVILREADYERWLDPGTPLEVAKSLLVPYPADDLEAYPISKFVNSPKNEGPECVEPLVEEI